jgi:hypothetical protein
MKRFLSALVCAASLALSSASAVPYLVVDEPCTIGEAVPCGAFTAGRDFSIRGSALNSDVVHVWGFPSTGAVFLGAAYTGQADVVRKLDTGAFSLMVRNAPVGIYPIVIYAHDPSTGTFPTQIVIQATVRACQMFFPEWPMMSPGGMVYVTLPFCSPQQ